MKTSIFVILALFIFCSCNKNIKEKLNGTWQNISIYNKDTIYRFVEIDTDKKSIYFLSKYGIQGEWSFSKGLSTDSIKEEGFKFISDNQYEEILNDTIKKILNITSNPISNRVKKDIKPNKLALNLVNTFNLYSNSIDIDTMNSISIFYKYDLKEIKGKNIYEIEKQLKFFMEKQIKSLPKTEELSKYDEWSKSLLNIYTWEDLNTKILMECRFKNKDLTDNYTFNDVDELQVKIWQDIKN